MNTPLGLVVSLFRYPVKSMLGERLTAVDVSTIGFHGDRSFGVVDSDTGRLLSAKTVPQLLRAQSTLREDNEVEITLESAQGAARRSVSSADPDVHRWLSDWLGRSVRLERPTPDQVSRIDIEVDLTERGGAEDALFTFQSKPGLFFDGSPIHLLTTASLKAIALAYPQGDWVEDRFRPNVLIDVNAAPGYAEDDWVGFKVQIGSVVFDVHKRCDRCVLTTRTVGNAPADREILRTLHREHGGDLGVKATTVSSGRAQVGDVVSLQTA